ncbi:MAG: hupR1, partial [Phycisphaerales bacterium]|nr:hupR1 [Phycisphaerales bacterium]
QSSAATFKRPILVVDDEPEMLFSVRNLLRREFDVHTAGSGADGIKILEEHEIHLVMTDQRMPEMTGVELLRRVKCEHPGAMRLIFTGFADIRAVIDAINQGNVFRYITKPWEPEDLLAALREAGQRYDLIARRNQLLKEMRSYEASCIGFKDELLSGKLGTLVPDGVTEAERLVQAGRELLGRLDRTLTATQHEPMS